MTPQETFKLADLAPTRPRRPRWQFVVIATVAALALAGGSFLTWKAFQPDGLTIRGQLVLTTDQLEFPDGTSCIGRNGLADIQPGAQVTVTDAAGDVIALGALERGHRGSVGECVFPFEIKAPSGQGFYGLEVARRGQVRFPESDVANGAVTLTLGS